MRAVAWYLIVDIGAGKVEVSRVLFSPPAHLHRVPLDILGTMVRQYIADTLESRPTAASR